MSGKAFVLVLAALLLAGCLSGPSGQAQELDDAAQRWVKGLQDENIELIMSTYWSEAELLLPQAEGGERRLRGSGEIRRMQQDGFDLPLSFRDLHVTETDRQVNGDTATVRLHVEGPDWTNVNLLRFQRRGREWRIIQQVIEPLAAEEAAEGSVPVASALQAWCDADGSGALEPPELRQFSQAVYRLLAERLYPVQTPLDRLFDFNANGQIDFSEQVAARNLLLMRRMRDLPGLDPELAAFFDLNGDAALSVSECMQILESIVSERMWRRHEILNALDRRIDADGNGVVDEAEISRLRRQLVRALAILPVGANELPPPALSKRDIFSFVDLNRNGTVEPSELRDSLVMFNESLVEVGGVETPLNEYFDRNRNGVKDLGEVEEARRQILVPALPRMFELDADLAARFLDLNGNRRVDDAEVHEVLSYVFQGKYFVTEPRTASAPIEKRMDENLDGTVNAEESWRFYHRLVGASAAAWLKAPQERMDAWAVTSVLDGIVDLNRDGLVDAEENRLSAEALRGPHPVESGFDRRIDFNANGQVEWFEINRAQHAGKLPLREEELPRKLPSQTAIDRYLDLNEDGTVGREELDRIARMLYDPETAELPPRWRELLDLDKNGRLSREELVKSWELYFRPHPATTGSQLDRRLDRNGNGFVEPDEIGIAAGRSQGLIFGALDQRVERLAWQKAGSPGEVRVTGQDEQPRFQSEYYQRLGLIQDRKLAVVGITSGTRIVDEETASGVMVFIEHSFVNVGKVRVVDRQNIAKIVKEYEFQQSELTDEATAVRIGKLSGADIIVIGSISYVGEIYYLNIKLISVETGEIIGSSIADANGPKEFYGMCNEAVYSLF